MSYALYLCCVVKQKQKNIFRNIEHEFIYIKVSL